MGLMSIDIVSESAAHLPDYASVPMAVLVTERFEGPAIQAMADGIVASATPVSAPYWKNYDSYSGNSPADWTTRFDTSHWKIFVAYHDGRRAGGAVLIHGDAQIDLLDGRSDLALMWDVRVAADARRLGVGRALLEAVAGAAKRAECRALRVETQNVNVPACRFYQACGFVLETVRHQAYPDLPDEIQLLWTLSLTSPDS